VATLNPMLQVPALVMAALRYAVEARDLTLQVLALVMAALRYAVAARDRTLQVPALVMAALRYAVAARDLTLQVPALVMAALRYAVAARGLTLQVPALVVPASRHAAAALNLMLPVPGLVVSAEVSMAAAWAASALTSTPTLVLPALAVCLAREPRSQTTRLARSPEAKEGRRAQSQCVVARTFGRSERQVRTHCHRLDIAAAPRQLQVACRESAWTQQTRLSLGCVWG